MLPPLPLLPGPTAARLTRAVRGHDHTGSEIDLAVVEERPLTIYLNAQEIVTAITIGDYPEYLALGFLRNQGMLQDDDKVTGIDYDEDIETVVVRTDTQTSYEDKLKKKTRTSGCAVGTVFGDMMEGLEGVTLPEAEPHKLALCPVAPDQYAAVALPQRGRDPWHGAVSGRPSADLHGGCRSPQRCRKNRGLHAAP